MHAQVAAAGRELAHAAPPTALLPLGQDGLVGSSSMTAGAGAWGWCVLAQEQDSAEWYEVRAESTTARQPHHMELLLDAIGEQGVVFILW